MRFDFRRRVRAWRRRRAASLWGSRIPPTSGKLILAACREGGAIETPLLGTVLRAGREYRGMEDTEIRGFLDGGVKFERNVATQYHVRIGCEASGAVAGRSEVMRVLQRWDISPLPACARVAAARLVLRQEDITRFPHRQPLRWPVTFYLHEVRKPWGPGRGGVGADNVSSPEPGDAWWLEARAGELAWQVPGCGFGSESDPRADRAAEPLAAATIHGPGDDLVFTGPRLAGRVEASARAAGTLEVLIAASAADENLPGSIKAFYSRDHGEDGNPTLRPRLEVEWTSRADWVEERPFVLEPGGTAVVRPDASRALRDGARIATSLELSGNDPLAIPPDVIVNGAEARITTALQPVPAGDSIRLELLETWTPAVESPDRLAVAFRFTAPSGRVLERAARHAGAHRFACEVSPDEMGVWRYAWSCVPDARFGPHEGSGWITVVRRADGAHLSALRAMAEAAALVSESPKDLVSRKRAHVRLTALTREVLEYSRTDAPASETEACRELLETVTKAIARCA